MKDAPEVLSPMLLSLLVYLIIMCLILWLFYYVINTLAPEPFRRVLNVVLVVVGVIILIYFLLNLVATVPTSTGLGVRPLWR